jgi:hypothetical protein
VCVRGLNSLCNVNTEELKRLWCKGESRRVAQCNECGKGCELERPSKASKKHTATKV